jgi:ribonuclease BN (tRNA processing enzyme)
MAGASVLFLGTGDAFCNGGRLHTAFHVAADGYQALIDCGATTIAVMRHLEMDIAAIDAILVSHLHGDHFGGIPFLLMDALFNAQRTKLLTIVGPVGTRLRVMDTLGCLYPGAPAKAENLLLRFIEFKDRESLAVGPLGVLPIPVVHPSGSTAYGLRVNIGGRVVAFSGDTAWTPALADIARDADLFICECHGFDAPEATHLHYKELRPALPELKARRTVLTHLGTAMLANLGALDVEVAEDGQTIML